MVEKKSCLESKENPSKFRGFYPSFLRKKGSLGSLSLKARTETDQKDGVAWLFFF
jgi:hypothetical protein